MTSYQTPNIPAPLQAIEIDKAIYSILLKLDVNLPWLSHEYGRAYRFLDRNDKRLYFPEVYIGGENMAYYRPTPDNDKSGMCFFVVGKEDNYDFDRNISNYLRWDVGIIFSVNLKLINPTLLLTENFTQNLIRDVREVLTRKLAGLSFGLEIKTVEREFKEIYREWSLLEQETHLKAPLSGFRFNCVITCREECDNVLNPVSLIQTTLSKMEIVKAVLPNVDFTDPIFLNALTPQQRIDLLANL